MVYVLSHLTFFMPKPLIQLCIAMLLCVNLYAQQTAADTIPINKDSIEKELDEFLKMFGSPKPASYFLVGIGVGNTQFSVKNIALNSQQSSSNLSIIPTVGYYFKSGLNLSYNNYLLKEGQSIQLLQHSVTVGYDYPKSKEVAFGFSYTRFLGKKEFVNTSSPYDNDLFAYVNKQKGIFQPGVMVGFSAGKYRETSRYLDSQRVTLFPPSYVYFYVNDTSTVRVRDFSFIPFVQHEFEWKGFGKKDAITFKPCLMFIGGVSNFSVDSKGRKSILNRPKLGRAYSQSASESSGFKFYSVGLNLDAAWYVGKFYLNPQVYLDDYLLSSENKFNVFYTVQLGFMF